MMRLKTLLTVALLGTTTVLFAPCGARGADASSSVTVTATRATGAEAVTISGSAPAGAQLVASLYARYSQDLPTILLSRHPIATNASGRFTSTLPIAPAFFRNAVVTVVVQALAEGSSANATFTVGPPNVPSPADEVPSSVR